MVAGSIPAGITGDLGFTRHSIYNSRRVCPFFENKQAPYNKKTSGEAQCHQMFFYFNLRIQVNFG
jgi:hypothetical protein